MLICPGLVSRDADGVPDVMRGEEVQIVGALSHLRREPGNGFASRDAQQACRRPRRLDRVVSSRI